MAFIDDYVASVVGRSIEVEDPSNADQCMDLAFDFLDRKGIPRAAIRHLFAYQVFTNPNDLTRQCFEIVPNTPDGVPPAEALVIFGTIVGPAGHICIALPGANTVGFRSADQNWDIKNINNGRDKSGDLIPKVAVINHSYRGVLGWLIPKAPAPAPAAPAGLAGFQRQVLATAKARVRNAPRLNASILKEFDVNTILDFKGFIHGDAVNDTDIWFVGRYSNPDVYVHSSCFTDRDTHDLPDLTPPPPAPVPTPPSAPVEATTAPEPDVQTPEPAPVPHDGPDYVRTYAPDPKDLTAQRDVVTVDMEGKLPTQFIPMGTELHIAGYFIHNADKFYLSKTSVDDKGVPFRYVGIPVSVESLEVPVVVVPPTPVPDPMITPVTPEPEYEDTDEMVLDPDPAGPIILPESKPTSERVVWAILQVLAAIGSPLLRSAGWFTNFINRKGSK